MRFIIRLMGLGFLWGFMGCGSEDLGNLKPRLVSGGGGSIINYTPDSNAGSGDVEKTSVTTNALVFLQGANTINVNLSSEFASQCVDGSTQIQWSITGDPTMLALDRSGTCRPTVSISSNFMGEQSLQAVMTLADKIVTHRVSIRLFDPARCAAIGGMEVGRFCAVTVCDSAALCQTRAGNAQRKISATTTTQPYQPNAQIRDRNAAGLCTYLAAHPYQGFPIQMNTLASVETETFTDNCGYSYGLTHYDSASNSFPGYTQYPNMCKVTNAITVLKVVKCGTVNP